MTNTKAALPLQAKKESAMQAITVKYHGPTNCRGSRYSAKCAAGSITVGYDHSQNIDGNVRAVVQALLVKLNWLPGEGYPHAWHIGQTANGDYVAVYAAPWSNVVQG